MKGGQRTEKTRSRPSLIVKVAIVLVLVAAVAGAFYLKERSGAPEADANTANGSDASAVDSQKEQSRTDLPRLVDLGAGKCIPCKLMAPILEELRKEYRGKFDVVFIDVWKDRSAGSKYRVRVIPTQIFYDAEGTERFRHEGFYSKEDILGKWKELGINF